MDIGIGDIACCTRDITCVNSCQIHKEETFYGFIMTNTIKNNL